MIGKVLYKDQPCERCGSKKSISNIHDVITPALIGSVKVGYSQIICTNHICQKEFERNLLEEMQKKEAIRLKREEDKTARKVRA